MAMPYSYFVSVVSLAAPPKPRVPKLQANFIAMEMYGYTAILGQNA